MIKKFLYSIKDTVRGVYLAPFVSDNDESAKRDFDYNVEKSPFKRDLQLYKVADFIEDTGDVGGFEPVFICSYTEAVNNG